MVDLDHFKDVNDRHGHAAGDAVLVQMQERLREVFRESDYLVRWGGEEFLVLARATRRDEARVVAERIRRAVADREFLLPDGERLRKTCSIGFACFPFVPDAAAPVELVRSGGAGRPGAVPRQAQWTRCLGSPVQHIRHAPR